MNAAENARDREFEFGEGDFKFLAEFVNRKTGIVLGPQKKDMVYSRLAKRLRSLKLKTFREYCDLVSNDQTGEEITNLVNSITTNLTGFFRENHHFEHLAGILKKEYVAKNPAQKKLRIWSSACSSGQEPYSIAMTLHESIPNLSQWDARILATDIDTNMVRTAAAGEYSRENVEAVDASYKKKYMDSTPNGVVMDDTLKASITFKQLNLLESWPMKGPMDIIFCRNVVIYFDKKTQAVLFNRMADLMRPKGYLYIGHSESLNNVSDRFELIGKTIYQKIK